MFEDITYEEILDRMLDRVPDNVDKREGSIIYDALAPAAAELQSMYISLDSVLDECYADTASWDYLVRRTTEQGIFPKQATNAVLKGVFNCEVPIGSRFSRENENYTVIEKIRDFEYKVQCDTTGTIGNLGFGVLIPIDYIQGLEVAELTDIITPGQDEETEEELRTRYYKSVTAQAFGGNVADYKEKINNIAGVGGVKIYPVWNGGGTVKTVVLTSNYQKPSDTFIQELQGIIDPKQNTGKGMGIAPIGHYVTVTGVKEVEVNVETSIIYKNGWNLEKIKSTAMDKIEEYLENLRRQWEDTENIIVRITQLEMRLINIEGILDIRDTKINGIENNLELASDEVPIRGDFIG